MSNHIHTQEHDTSCSCGHDYHEHSHNHSCGGNEHDHSCSCEHEHHHEHNTSCSCKHEQHHKHNTSCSCGHEHHLEHDNSCSCGHEQPHECHKHPHSGKIKSHVYILENLGCANCAAKMESQIQNLPGVTYATITFATKQLRISADNYEKLLPEIQKICSSIESEVKVVEKDAPLKQSNTFSSEDSHITAKKEKSGDHKESLQIISGAALFVIGLILHHNQINEFLSLVVFIIGYLILGGKILKESVRNILKGQVFDENFLMSIATLGAFAIREYPEAIGVMLFYRVGEFFEHKAVERSRNQIMDAVDMRPEVVNLLSGDEIRVIPAENVQIGDILLVRPGDRIPLDGVVIEGESRLDTSPITGEPVPVTVKCGDELISGCVNTSGQLKMRVEKPLEESMVTRILNSVENAAANKPKIDRFITRFARIYTPIIVFAALATAIIPSLITDNWNYWIYTALTFLVMSCPCALVLSVPLAFFSGIGTGSKKGILFKGGLAIEALSQIKTVVMDKTGTITQGNFKVQKVISVNSGNEEELLRLCASCEQNSTHPIAHSIVAAAQEKELSLSTALSLKEIAGHGIIAELPEGKMLCGNLKLMEMNQIDISKMKFKSHGAEVFLAINGICEGYILISDTIKSDAKSAISRLKQLGLHTTILTGDSEDSANAVAAETGINEVYAKLLPQDKLNILTQIRSKHGSVMFVGDGINDAPVLAGADVGAAMGSGADAAIEAADTVFMTSNVESIPDAISIARSTSRIAMQNIVFALIIKIAVMILGLCGFANMWLAVFADTGVAMLCVLNSIRILYKK